MLQSAPHRIISVLMTLLVGCAAAMAGDSAALPRPDANAAQQKTVSNLLAQLETEANQIRAEGKLPAAEPDIATRFEEQLPAELVGVILLHRLNDDAFTDAYTRWQLLSYHPALPELTDAQFLSFMDQTPALLENPWADDRIIELFERAEKTGAINPGAQEKFRRLETQLNERADVARHLNHCAETFREWVAQQIGDKGIRPRLWLLEECSATIAGGWPTRSVKMRLSRDFSNSIAEEAFTGRDRAAVAQAAQMLAGRKRRFVSQFTFKADGTIEVQFSTAQVTDSDVENWRNRLFGRVLK